MFHGRLCPAVCREHVPSRFGVFSASGGLRFYATINCSKILCVLVHDFGISGKVSLCVKLAYGMLVQHSNCSQTIPWIG